MGSDRTDQSNEAIWQAAMFALRRYVSTNNAMLMPGSFRP